MAEKQNKAAKTPQRTEIKELGRIAALDKLFEKTTYKNSDVQLLNDTDYYYMTANRIMMEGVDFDLTYTPIKYLGYKMAIFAMGPLYARNYAPYVLSFNVGLSAKFSYEKYRLAMGRNSSRSKRT
jgi:thiamine-monophosphate kinase